MLTRGEDYAHQEPSLTKKKLRRLELTAGAPKYAKTARGVWSASDAIRQAERELPSKPSSPTAGWSKTSKPEPRRETWARVRHRSAHEIGPQRGKAARQTQSS
jgi:hypothetical protein